MLFIVILNFLFFFQFLISNFIYLYKNIYTFLEYNSFQVSYSQTKRKKNQKPHFNTFFIIVDTNFTEIH